MVQILSRSYYLCVNIFNEREFPQYFASGILALVIVASITVLADAMGYITDPSMISSYSKYYKYFSLVSLLFSWWFFNRNKRYLRLIEQFNEMNITKRRILAVVSILYLTLLFISFFKMGNLIREYNLKTLP